MTGATMLTFTGGGSECRRCTPPGLTRTCQSETWKRDRLLQHYLGVQPVSQGKRCSDADGLNFPAVRA
jgi:hypothetical protein